MAQIGFIVLASVAVYAFVRSAQNDHRVSTCNALCAFRPNYAGRDRRAPDFELTNYEGKKVRFSSFLGKGPVVLNFWTKTCKPCLEEMPSLADMARIVAKDGVKVVTVCTDSGPDAVRDHLEVLLQGKKPPFEILFDPETEVVTDKFGTTLFPETWILDKHGIIRARVDGARDWTGPMALEVIEMVGRGSLIGSSGCPVAFTRGRPSGPFRGLCGDDVM